MCILMFVYVYYVVFHSASLAILSLPASVGLQGKISLLITSAVLAGGGGWAVEHSTLLMMQHTVMDIRQIPRSPPMVDMTTITTVVMLPMPSDTFPQKDSGMMSVELMIGEGMAPASMGESRNGRDRNRWIIPLDLRRVGGLIVGPLNTLHEMVSPKVYCSSKLDPLYSPIHDSAHPRLCEAGDAM